MGSLKASSIGSFQGIQGFPENSFKGSFTGAYSLILMCLVLLGIRAPGLGFRGNSMSSDYFCGLNH